MMGPVYIFLFIFQAALGADQFCAVQERSVRVTEGETVTIPCELTYPEDKAKRRQVQAQWFELEDGDCSGGTYMKSDKYEGRLFYSKSNRSESIIIHNVNKKDGPVICCQIVTLPGHFNFFSSHGTHLLFSGQMWVNQLEAVPAQTGGNTIIPCYINYPPGYNAALSGVTWKRGIKCRIAVDTDTNEKNNINSRFSLVNFPDDVSLRINNVQEGDGMIYCCSVTFGDKQYSSKHGTELVIQGSRSHIGPNINQPQESSAQAGGDATIRCLYNIDNDGEYIFKQVYWRAGSPVGPIAYHPSRWMVHPTYKGRTMITRQADLRIKGVTVTDSNTYYCFVILRSCVGNQNITTSINYGLGTRLNVTGPGARPVAEMPQDTPGPVTHVTSYSDKGSRARPVIQMPQYTPGPVTSVTSYTDKAPAADVPSALSLRIILAVRVLVFCVVIVGGILGYRNVRSDIKSSL